MEHASTVGSPKRVLVTGAIGNVGREVVRALVDHGHVVRAADPSVEAIHEVHGEALDAVSLDYEEIASFEAALEGCDALFLIRPPAVVSMEATLIPFIDAALGKGVKHIVFLSVVGAA